MYILLIIYFVFLVIFLAFNVYGVLRVISMRLQNDATNLAVIVYLAAIVLVIVLTLIAFTHLDWSKTLTGLI